MDEKERQELVSELLARLRAEGVPGGMWLLELERVERSLADSLAVVRRMTDAIVRAAVEEVMGDA